MQDRGWRIDQYQREAAACTLCRDAGLLHRETDGRWAYPLFHRGTACASGVLIVAEAPNHDDTYHPKKGRLTCDPDTDPSGRFLFELLGAVGLRPGDVLFTNTVLCLPAPKDGKHPVTSAPAKQCLVWLERLIRDVEPGVVVALGGKALEALARIERHRLELHTGAGRLHSWFGRRLLPLYHPSLLGRVSRPEAQQRADIQALRPYLVEQGWPSPAATAAP